MASMTATAEEVNTDPAAFADCVAGEAANYRARGTPVADFIAEQLERVSQLIRWTGAVTPQQYAERLECWEMSVQDGHYERGLADGRHCHGDQS